MYLIAEKHYERINTLVKAYKDLNDAMDCDFTGTTAVNITAVAEGLVKTLTFWIRDLGQYLASDKGWGNASVEEILNEFADELDNSWEIDENLTEEIDTYLDDAVEAERAETRNEG